MAARVFMKLSKTVLTFAALVFLTVNPAAAADKAAVSAEPDPNANPMLAQYVKDGIKLYYLGTRSGLDGWFLMKDGQIEIAYTTPDKQSIFLGVLFGTNGDAVTEQQIHALAALHPEISTSLQQSMTQIQQNSIMPAPLGGSPAGGGVPPTSVLSNGNMAPALLPSEKLVQELQTASGVDVGNHLARELYMIMDPNCPHCQATWRILRDAVFKNNLQIHLVPIGRNDEDERAAAQLLKASDPLNVWDKYVSGDKSQLAGEPDPLMLAAIKANHTLVDRWSIKETPYIVYRGKDKKIKILAGEAQNPDAFLNDIGP